MEPSPHGLLAFIGDENAGCVLGFRYKREHAMLKRRRIEQTDSLKDRLASFAKDVRQKASLLPPGHEKDQLLRRARQADTAAHLNDWANSPGLRAPE